MALFFKRSLSLPPPMLNAVSSQATDTFVIARK
jgi:hypothetical protein